MRHDERTGFGGWLRKKLRITSPSDRVLHVTAEGVTLRDRLFDKDLWDMRWSDVETIVAFKIDQMTVDCICLGFHVTGSTTMWIADEETRGWDTLNRELAKRFGVRFEEWFGRVAFPAFATNETLLWSRAKETHDALQTEH